MSITLYVSCDSGAVSLGANRVADEIVKQAQERGLPITLIRNGSRGMYWLETLVEVATDAGRIAYGPVQVNDVAGLFDADFLHAGSHPLALGFNRRAILF